jgi:hypothetical protein
MGIGGRIGMKLKIFTALVVVLVPVLAQAKPRTATVHTRPQLFRDRAPKARLRDTHTHEIKVRPSKSPPPPAVKEDF